MRFAKIPHIENAWNNVQIKTLSPSTFAWVNRGCGYQVLLQKALQTFNDKALLLPSNHNALLGKIIHKLYELTQKGDLRSIVDLKNKWEELVTLEKEKLAIEYPTLQNADLNDYDKRNSAIRYALGIMRKHNTAPTTAGTTKVYAEKWLDCAELGLIGIADKLITDGEYIDVLDFKSGHMLDETGNIKTEYIIQLHLYATMCQHLSMGTPRHLTLVDIDGENHNVPYSQAYSEQLLSKVQETIGVLNNIIATRKFKEYAKTELGLCANCECRHVCDYRAIPAESYYQTIIGEVIEIPSTNMYVLRNGDDKLYISGLDAYNVDNPKEYIGRTLTFVNVIRASQSADEYTYKITENTLAYEQE